MTDAKHWVISATLSTAPGLSFDKGGHPVEPLAAGLSPAEFLLLSAAGCMALSLKAAALASGTSLTVIRVTASGRKPLGAPSRLSDVDLQIALIPALAREGIERLIADAQQMCTVTNTIRDSARLTVRIDPAALTHIGTTQPAPITGDPA